MKHFILIFALLSQVAVAQPAVRGNFRVSSVASSGTTTTPVATTTTPVASNTATTVTVVVNWISAPVNATSVIADLKYNKKLAFGPVKDDGGIGDWQVLNPVINGGVGADGVTYQPRRYDDGTGKLVDWHYTYALNWNYGQISSTTSAPNHLAIYQRGFSDISNHSLTHAGYVDRYYDIHQNAVNLFNFFGAKTTTLTVPTSFEGFVEPYFALGGIMTASQGYGQSGLSADDNNVSPNANVIYTERVKSSETRRLITTRRIFDDAWTTAALPAIKSFADTAFNASYGTAANTKFMFQWFSHGPSYSSVADTAQRNNYIRFLDYIQNHPKNTGQVWMTGIQEFADYLKVKQTVTKTQAVNGNTQTITLNYGTVNSDIRWRDISLLASGGTIASVQVTGADSSSYNPTTGLINIYYRKTTFADPSTDVLPPQLLSAGTVSSNLSVINLKYDRPVSQSVVAGYSVYINALAQSNRNPPNLGDIQTITSLTGSGTDWQLNLSSPLSSSAVVDYRIQRGNTVDAATGQKMISYIGMPVSVLDGDLATSAQKTLTVRQFGSFAQTLTINGATRTGNRFAFATGTSVTVTMTITSTDASKVLSSVPYPASYNGLSKTLTYTLIMDSDKNADYYTNL